MFEYWSLSIVWSKLPVEPLEMPLRELALRWMEAWWRPVVSLSEELQRQMSNQCVFFQVAIPPPLKGVIHTPIMENHMEKKMEHDMETAIYIYIYVGFDKD